MEIWKQSSKVVKTLHSGRLFEALKNFLGKQPTVSDVICRMLNKELKGAATVAEELHNLLIWFNGYQFHIKKLQNCNV